jgi:hypothetical protein
MKILLTLIILLQSLVGQCQLLNHPYPSKRVVISDSGKRVTVHTLSTLLFYRKDTTPAFSITYEDGDQRVFTVTDFVGEHLVEEGTINVWEVKERNGKICRLSLFFDKDGLLSAVGLLTDTTLLVFFITDTSTLES